MRLIILGQHGSGKTTQGRLLSQKFKIPHLSTGNLLREEAKKNTLLGRKLRKTFKEERYLVKTSNMLVERKLKKKDCANGFILDNHPANIYQVWFLERLMKKMGTEIDALIVLEANKRELFRRILNRRICGNCQTEYNLIYKKPKKVGTCDVCGEKLIQRIGDTRGPLKERMEFHDKYTTKAIEHYRKKGKAIKINANKPVKVIFNDILKALKDRVQ